MQVVESHNGWKVRAEEKNWERAGAIQSEWDLCKTKGKWAEQKQISKFGLTWNQQRLGKAKSGALCTMSKGRKLKKNQQNKKGKERINGLFSVHHVSLTLPVDPRPAHMSAPVHICFYYYMIGCWENIGKPYLCVHWEGAEREGGGVILNCLFQ